MTEPGVKTYPKCHEANRLNAFQSIHLYKKQSAKTTIISKRINTEGHLVLSFIQNIKQKFDVLQI